MARVMGTLRDNELITQFTMRLKRQLEMDITPFWNGFTIVRFTESHSSRLDGTKHSAHTTTRFQKADHTYVCTAEEHKRRENSWVLVHNSQGKKGSDESTRRPRRSHQNQRAIVRRVWRSKAKNPLHQTSMAKSESYVLKIQCRSRTS